MFVTDVEAGPVALIASGLLFVLLAMAGRLPRRLKVGENETEFYDETEQVGKVLASVVELTQPSERSEVLSQVEELATVAPRAAAPALRALTYEQVVGGMLRIAVAEWDRSSGPGAMQLGLEQGRIDRGFDAAVIAAPHVRIAIEIKFTSGPLRSDRLDSILGRLATLRSGETSLLIVANHKLTASTASYLSKAHPPVRLVVVDGPDDQEQLNSVLYEMIRDDQRRAHRSEGPQ